MDTTPSDTQLERIVRTTARLELEIERNLRDPRHLLRMMTRPAWDTWQRARPPGGFPQAGPVVDADLGATRVTRLSDRKIMVTIATRTHDDRWSALTFTLRGERGRWTVWDLHRLAAGRHYRHPKPKTRPTFESPDAQIDRARGDHHAAVAALTAAAARLADLPASDSHRGPTSELVDRWRAVIDRLDRDLAALQARARARQQVERAHRR